MNALLNCRVDLLFEMARRGKKTAAQKRAEQATRRRRESLLNQAEKADDSGEEKAPPLRPVLLNGRKGPGQPRNVRKGRKGSISKTDPSWAWRTVFTWVVFASLGMWLYSLEMKDLHDTVISVADKLPLSVKNWLESFHAPAPKDQENQDESISIPHDWHLGPDLTKKLYSLDEIKYKQDGPLLLVLIGHVFDVTGADYYQPGSGYHAFIGK